MTSYAQFEHCLRLDRAISVEAGSGVADIALNVSGFTLAKAGAGGFFLRRNERLRDALQGLKRLFLWVVAE
jgi:hypothetical protein